MSIRVDEARVVNNRLTQVGSSFRVSRKHRVAVFKCECGGTIVTDPRNVKCGTVKSCGCRRFGQCVRHGHTVGRKRSATHSSWSRMHERCSAKPGSHHWTYYGAKGITVCARWNLFENFLADMGERPDAHTIDRIDGSKGYSPENCRWATKAMQCRNVSDNRMLTHNNRTMCVKDWADEIGMRYHTLLQRITKLHWSVERAFTTPVGNNGRRKHA